jgi:hypothetical protein
MAKHILHPLEKRRGIRVTVPSPWPVSDLDSTQRSEAPPATLVEAMQLWCEEAQCGRRTAYDIFEFKTEAERTMFTVRWS